MTKPNLLTAKPDEVVAYVKQKIRQFYGDRIENASTVFASHGRFYIELPAWEGWLWIGRRSEIPALVRRRFNLWWRF